MIVKLLELGGSAARILHSLTYEGFKIKLEPRDAWIGLYWSAEIYHPARLSFQTWTRLKLYFCLVPFLPLIFTFSWFTSQSESYAKYDSRNWKDVPDWYLDPRSNR